MNVAQALDDLASRFGILPGYIDLAGSKQTTGPDTKKALLRGAGLVLDNDAMIFEALADVTAREDRSLLANEIVIESGRRAVIECPASTEWRIVSELQNEVCAGRAGKGGIKFSPLPSGIYGLEFAVQGSTGAATIIVAPPGLPSVDDITGTSRIWGINLALYGLRSERNTGLGDYEDLAQAAERAAEFGAGFVGINPVHALGWHDGGTRSPYSPSHRGFLNTTHIALDRIIGLENNPRVRKMLTAAELKFAPVRASEAVNYLAHQTQHQILLEHLFPIFIEQADPDPRSKFNAFCLERGRSLIEFALFESLSEDHGADWRNWPGELKDKNNAQVADAEKRLQSRICFHSWIQWLADQQLSGAQRRAKCSGMTLGLYQDLAVGPRRGAAESWCENDTVALGVSLGVPPDQFSPLGQNWNLAAFAPNKLSTHRFANWQRVIAQAMRHSGILRIDHVLGMNRSYWIPDDGSPGGYVQQLSDVLFGIISILAERAGTVVIGEDLGLVPHGFRKQMRGWGFYGYSVLQFEKTDTGHFRAHGDLRQHSLACFGTHDTPTLKGYWQGRDIDWWQELGWIDQNQADRNRCDRNAEKRDLLSIGPAIAPEAASEARNFESFRDSIHQSLACSPAAMVSVQLDDIFGLGEAQNLPGTIDEHPNWQRRYPISLEDFSTNAEFLNISQIMADSGRSPIIASPKETKNDG